MRYRCIVGGTLCALLCVAHHANAQTSTERLLTGLGRPVFATAPAGDSQRLFIAEQHTGIIKILNLQTGNLLGTPFLDIGGLATGNEQGLLGLAFDPNYATNGYFYLNITTSTGGGDTVIRRYRANGPDFADADTADAGSATTILTFDQPQGNHNGGWIGFGPNDDYLYIASGDGGNGNDIGTGHTSEIGNAQDITNNKLGKMLRIDVGSDDFPDDALRNYAIPDDNPFVDVTGDDEIWSYGLRNPYRSSFDRATGDLWIGDVGQNRREEIDLQRADSLGGENYGWRLREGTIATPTGGVGGNPPPGNVEPIYDYAHGSASFQGNVVIGGYVYRGPVEHFRGHYLFADGESHNIWKLDPDAISPAAAVTRVNDDLLPDQGSIAFIGSFGEDTAGNLYIMEVFGGEMFRITSDSQDIVWNGDDATAGVPGDGVSWSDADNWTRDGVADLDFVNEDHVIFADGSSQPTISLGETRTVSAVTFQSGFTLAGNTLRVLSGNVTVEEGVTATVEAGLEAETLNHSLRKLGPGMLLVDGVAAQTAVKEGTLGGTGTLDYLTVKSGATVAPGASIGTLSVESDFILEEGATLEIEIGGTDPTEFDRLVIDGNAEVLEGALDVRLVALDNDVYQPQAGDSFGFLSASGGFGMFGAMNLPELEPGLVWQLNPGGITVSLHVESVRAGDLNGDGVINFEDLSPFVLALTDPQAYAESFSGQFRIPRCDASGDGACNFQDLSPFTRLLTEGPNSAAAVPEPTTRWLLVAGLIGWWTFAGSKRHAGGSGRPTIR